MLAVEAFAASVAEDLAAFQVADGFEVNLFASETNGVVKPIQIRFDAKGRLWVIGSTVYPQIEPGQKPNDKVLVVEDTNGDGRADKTTVFADGLMIPTGLEVVENGCYVGHGTELLLLKDLDGDLKADERRVVLRGFGTGDNHQNINSFLWGPGGELFMCQGLHTHSHVETPWGISSLEKAGLWRFRPRLLRLDGFYGSAHEPQNPWGWVFTDWGEPIVLAGNNHSHIYPVPGMVVNHRDDPPSLIWKNGNGRKCSGGDIVGTAHFPDTWQGVLITGGYINNAVWALQLRDDGAGFALEDLPPLIKSTSRSFRPVDVKFGPDGALYIADWHNPIIGHYQASFRHPDRDKTHGRIWRVTAKGRLLTRPPALATATLPELLDHLNSADRWTRHFAKRVLADKPTEQVSAAVSQWAGQPGRSERALVGALGVLQSHEIVSPELLDRLVQAREPGARAYAASVIGAWAERFPDALRRLQSLASDPAPRVRLQAVVACSYFTNAAALETAARAADFPTDKFLDYAFRQTVFALKPYWLPALRSGRMTFDNRPARATMLVRADGTSDTVEALRALLRRDSIDERVREIYWRILADVGDANDLAALLQADHGPSRGRLLASLRAASEARKLQPAGNLAALLQPWVMSGDEAIAAEALQLAGLWQVELFHAAAEAAAIRVTAPHPLRRAAIKALEQFGTERDRVLLMTLAGGNSPEPIAAAAIAALVTLDESTAARLAAAMLSRSEDQTVAREIYTAFLQRIRGASILTAAIQTAPPSAAAAKAGLEAMNATGRRDDDLARSLLNAAGITAQPLRFSASEMAAFANETRMRGNAARGREVFERPALGCIACHAVNGKGGAIGPNLSAVGSAQPIDFIVGAILDPQKEIKEGYTAIAVTTHAGEEFQGNLVRQTRDETVLLDVLQQREVRLRRADIAEQRNLGSVMPPGLADTLSRDEFRDLVRYLSELGRAR
jgi:putative heme-binding domain-containing protein